MARFERQRLDGDRASELLLIDAKRVVMRDLSSVLADSHMFVMDWTPRVHFNVRHQDEDAQRPPKSP
ncbi:hypothetical protein DFLDMN_006208 (plasmid) [Cupriavidus sp. H19C3]